MPTDATAVAVAMAAETTDGSSRPLKVAGK